jgi:hypothetical protein
MRGKRKGSKSKADGSKMNGRQAQGNEPIPQLNQVFRSKPQRHRMEVLLVRYRALQFEEKELEKEKNGLATTIQAILIEKNLKAVGMGTVTATREQGIRETILKELLLGQGVDPKTIRKCTKVTRYPKLVVRDSAKKESGREE